MGKIRWSLTAANDLKSIGDYIAQNSPYFAVAFVDRLILQIEGLTELSERGRVVPEFKRQDIRELIFQNYRIVYRLKDENVIIVSVSHSSMDILRKSKREGWEIS